MEYDIPDNLFIRNWPEVLLSEEYEEEMIEILSEKPRLLLSYVLRLGRRVEECEPLILQNPNSILNYARYIYFYDRWEEGEKALLAFNSPMHLFKYAKYVLKERWPEAESLLDEAYLSRYNKLFKTEEEK